MEAQATGACKSQNLCSALGRSKTKSPWMLIEKNVHFTSSLTHGKHGIVLCKHEGIVVVRRH
jgi:hypothetical protein